ncbi:MAG: energy-coupling factor transporter transmembrane component T, partial [Thermoplasmata archaeon]
MSEVIIPKFVMKNTVIHNLSLRVKLLFVILIFVLSMWIQDTKIYIGDLRLKVYAWEVLLLVVILIYFISFLAKVYKEFGVLSKYSLFTVIMVFLFNMLLYTSKPDDVCIYSLQICSIFGYNFSMVITDGAIVNSVTQALRLFSVMSIFFLFMLTQDPDAFYSRGKRFRSVRLLFMLTLRFYSILSRDVHEITNAMRARGVELDGPFFERIRNRS